VFLFRTELPWNLYRPNLTVFKSAIDRSFNNIAASRKVAPLVIGGASGGKANLLPTARVRVIVAPAMACGCPGIIGRPDDHFIVASNPQAPHEDGHTSRSRNRLPACLEKT
jgi:hypothetical protein